MEQVFFQEKNQWWWYQVVVIGANSIPTVIAVWGGMKKETSVSANSSIVLQLNYEAAAQLWGGLGMRWPWSEAPLWLDSAAVFPSCLLCLLCLQSVPLCTRPVRCLHCFISSQEDTLNSWMERECMLPEPEESWLVERNPNPWFLIGLSLCKWGFQILAI